MLFDYHVHTSFSDDGIMEMEDVVKLAIERKIDEICFSDHVDYGIKRDCDGLSKQEMIESRQIGFDEVDSKDVENYNKWLDYRRGRILNVDYPSYFKEIQRLQQKYSNQIILKQGFEFGIQTITLDDFQKLYDNYQEKIDFVLLSIHQIHNQEYWTNELFLGKSQLEYNNEYYDELYTVMKQFKDYSVLAHLDLINRYDPKGPIDFKLVEEKVIEILKLAIANHKGIEVNTSSFYYNLKDLTPSKTILKLYYDLGGRIITVGSDSHKPTQLGQHIKDIYSILKQIGFEFVCTYEKMKPIFHKL